MLRHTLSPLYAEGILSVGGVPMLIPNGLDGAALRTVFCRVDGLLLSSPNDWLQAFEDKFNNREDQRWQDMVDNARKKIDAEYNISNVVKQWLDIF